MFMIVPLMNISESLAILLLILLLVVVFILLALLIMSFVCTIIAMQIYVWQNLHYPTHDTFYKISYIITESL